MNDLVAVLHLAKESEVIRESFSEHKGIEVVERPSPYTGWDEVSASAECSITFKPISKVESLYCCSLHPTGKQLQLNSLCTPKFMLYQVFWWL